MNNSQPTLAPFGSWPSPISAKLVAEGGVRIGGSAARPAADGSTEIWWTEARPSEGGRVALVRQLADGTRAEALDPPWSVRTRVHEYGGGSWFNGPKHVYFSSWDDQRLYRILAESAGTADAGPPEAVTPQPEEPGAWRYADGSVTPDGKWIVCVSEDHHQVVAAENGEAVNSLVAIAASGGEPQVISQKSDFVAAPRFSPDGRWLSWYSWNHPDMPWDATTLCAAPVWISNNQLRLGNVKVVAGGATESVIGPNWTSDGQLVFSTDRSGFWNLHSWRPGDNDHVALTNLEDSEIGTPPWVFGLQQWAELDDGRVFAIVTSAATDSLAQVMPDRSLRPVPTGLAGCEGISSTGTELLLTALHADALPSLVVIDPDSGATRTVRACDDLGIHVAWLSRAEAITFSADGATSNAFFYQPTGEGINGTDGELPPLIVIGHGGPTAHSDPTLSLRVQYWTSRGFGVVDVNYRGSSGFGRKYRRLLNNNWGILDVADCIAAAEYLATAGKVDRARLAIRGGSAGGFTVLCALTKSEVFGAGTSLYGVADLEALATDTHKFESRYLDKMIGPYPEAKQIYEERSPINHTDRFSCPLLVLQGDEDQVVPPSQSEAIVAALAEKGIPHAYLLFEGEQHGFRKDVNIIRAQEAELWFYGRVFGFTPSDQIRPVEGAVGLDPS